MPAASVPFQKPPQKPTQWFLLTHTGQNWDPQLARDHHWGGEGDRTMGGDGDGHLAQLLSEAAVQIYPPRRVSSLTSLAEI